MSGIKVKIRFNFVIIILSVLMIFSCDTGVIPQNNPSNQNEQVSNPVFSLDSGTYNEYIDVELSSETKYAKIYYTIDGAEPTIESFLYSRLIKIEGDEITQTIKAFATRTGYEDSDIVSNTYYINCSVQTPVFSIAPGDYSDDILLEITCSTDNAIIYYTDDGSIPTLFSSEYTAPISISGDMTTKEIKAIAFKDGKDDSSIISGVYTIEYILNAPKNLAASNVNYNSITLEWDPVVLADEYVLYKFYMLPPYVSATSVDTWWDEIYRGADLFFTNDNLWAGQTIFYRVESYSDVKGTALSDNIQVNIPNGEMAFSHNLYGNHYYYDKDVYAEESFENNMYELNIKLDTHLNNQTSGYSSYGYISIVTSGSLNVYVIALKPSGVQYILTDEDVNYIISDGRAIGTFTGTYGTENVIGNFNAIIR